MTNLQAALGIAQLEQINGFIEKKRLIGNYYQKELKFLENLGFQLPIPRTSFAKNIYWVFAIIAPSEESKDKIVSYLNKQKIGTRPFFWCMHEQPVFQKMGLFKDEIYPNAERIARNGFYIPSGLGLETDDLQIVVNAMKDVC
jgi:perosamine synthetase